MEGLNSPRLPLSARWGRIEGAFWAVSRTAGLQSGYALERLGAGEVAWSIWGAWGWGEAGSFPEPSSEETDAALPRCGSITL